MSLRPKGYYYNLEALSFYLHVGVNKWWYTVPKDLNRYLDKSTGWDGDKKTERAVLIAPSNLMWWED